MTQISYIYIYGLYLLGSFFRYEYFIKTLIHKHKIN